MLCQQLSATQPSFSLVPLFALRARSPGATYRWDSLQLWKHLRAGDVSDFNRGPVCAEEAVGRPKDAVQFATLQANNTRKYAVAASV